MGRADTNGKSISKRKKVGNEGHSIVDMFGIPKDYDCYELGKRELYNYFLMYGGLLGLCGYLYYKNVLMILLFSVSSVLGLKLYKRMLAAKRRETLQMEFRDMLYSVSSTLSAGNSMKNAIFDAADAVELIYSQNSILARELRHMCRMIKDTKMSEEEVLKDFAARCKVEDVVNFVDVYSTCRRTGGNIDQIVVNASQMIVDKISIYREIEALTAQKKVEVKLLVAIPIGTLACIQLLSPDYLEVMYTTWVGRIIMTISFFSGFAALLWSMQMTKVNI